MRWHADYTTDMVAEKSVSSIALAGESVFWKTMKIE